MRRPVHAAILLVSLFGCSSDEPDSEAMASKPASGNTAKGDSARSPETKSVVTLTATAAARVRQIQAQQGAFLRVAVKRGGATGFMYDLRFDNQIDTDRDYVGRSHEVQIVVDRSSALFLEGTAIDWKTDERGTGFIFDNPNAVKADE